MKHLAAVLLLHMGGNKSPSADEVKNALASVGVDVDPERLEKMMKELEGKDIAELLQTGNELLANFGRPSSVSKEDKVPSPKKDDVMATGSDQAEVVVDDGMDMDGGIDIFGEGGGTGDY